MPNYKGKFEMKTVEFGEIDNIPANNTVDAEDAILREVTDIYPDAEEITVSQVEEMID